MHDGLEHLWGGETRSFRLGLGQLFAIEKRFDCGIGELLQRIDSMRWRIDEIREIIRQALIGAGLPASDADKVVAEHVAPGRLAEAVILAKAILAVALYGNGRDAPGKDEAADSAPATGSPPPLSTAPAP